MTDLRPYFSPPVNQGQVNDCSAAMACAGAYEFLEIRGLSKPGEGYKEVFESGKFERTSLLFQYYNSRLIKFLDMGASVGQAVQTLYHYGACPDTRRKE